MSELLSPRTDLGVAVQLVALLVLTGAGLWSTRRRPDARLVVVGLAMVAVALVGCGLPTDGPTGFVQEDPSSWSTSCRPRTTGAGTIPPWT